MRMVGAMVLVLMIAACGGKPTDFVEEKKLPAIFPDYAGVTIPDDIAPMNFCIPSADSTTQVPLFVEVKGSNGGEMTAEGDYADFDIDEWHALTAQNAGGRLTFTVYAQHQDGWHKYQSFDMNVSKYKMEEWGLTYRRIAPGYEVYSKMGLYQRELSSFDEYEIIENTRVPGMCVNCHTANRTDPKQMLFHVRGDHGATAMQIDGKCEMLNTKTDQTIGFCVYPYWHPEGRYVAFSTNTTRQSFHVVKDERIEVFDLASDLQIYDTREHRLILNEAIKDTTRWETFPAFSPDGKTLYFCSTTRTYDIGPTEYKVRYNLYSIPFDAKTETFGERIDTLVNAERDSMNVTLPRPSYDGKYLMYTKSNYGTFPIWHKEADLWLLNLKTGENRPLSEVNSSDTEAFHNWNLNSHWFVFSSRRGDGLYTRLYLSSIDDNGNCTKPFLLPQRNPKKFYDESIYSYNVPDFTRTRVDFDAKAAAEGITSDERVNIK